jgi:hypothetical protein
MTAGDRLDVCVLQRGAEAFPLVADEAGVALEVIHDRAVATEQGVLVVPEDHERRNGAVLGQFDDVYRAEQLMTRERVREVPFRDGGILGRAERREVSRTLLSGVLRAIAALSTPDLEEHQSLRELRMPDGARQADDRAPRVA